MQPAITILITGHAGFVGSAFDRFLGLPHGQAWARRVLGTGPDDPRPVEVIGVDIRQVRPYAALTATLIPPAPQWRATLQPGGVSMYQDVRALMSSARRWDLPVDLVIHCAAVVGGRTMIDGQPLTLAAEDLSIDGMFWSWALRTVPKRVVYFSSSAAYPTALQEPGCAALREDDIDLTDPMLPDQTYGWVKLTGERCAAEANAAGLRTFVFRPFSGYGRTQDRSYPWPSFIDRARARQDPFEVWGDGQQVRDFVHINDVVGFVAAAVEQDQVGPFNIGTGVPTSFDDLARLCMHAAGYDAPIAHQTRRPVGVQYRVADTTAADLIYRPKIALDVAVAAAVENRDPNERSNP